MDLIDKQPIMKFIVDGLNSGEFGHDAIEVLTELEYAPKVEAVTVVHGRFIEPVWNPPEEYDDDYTCSACGWSGTVCVCGEEQIGRKKVNYCPNCGAKMDEVSE